MAGRTRIALKLVFTISPHHSVKLCGCRKAGIAGLDAHCIQNFADPEATRRGTGLKHIVQKLSIACFPVEPVSTISVSVTIVVLRTRIIEVTTIMLVDITRKRNQYRYRAA